ncbi:MAG: 16S rRNA (cytosine(967)-C(5))-methyltransferase RsmB [Deltaproteobacteria bacterium]|nr:16S rRNA (cytosine(967)-C(5))-methyltransferase RsmB [Deltaproteobacteria bacterium]
MVKRERKTGTARSGPGSERLSDQDIRLEVCRLLREWEDDPQELEPLIDRFLGKLKQGCNPVQASLFTSLSTGVVRQRRRLDHFIDRLQRRPRKVKPKIKIILRLGLFELEEECRPAYAIVSETVNLARRMAPGSEGFVNGILRSFLREGAEKLLPVENPAEPDSLGIRWSLPTWLVESWLKDYGSEKAVQLCHRANLFTGTCFRVNRIRLSREDFIRGWQERDRDCSFTLGNYGEQAFSTSQAARLLASDWFREGLLSVQDEGAQLISELLAPQPGELILDACAAPGGKSTHLAELSGDRARIIALDRDRKRLPLIGENARRLGLEAITSAACDLAKPLPDEFARAFDAILIDAPCSGLGIIRRRADLRWRKSPEESCKLRTIQLQILENCSRYLKKGGRLVYATCTTRQRENQEVLSRFMERNDDFRLETGTELEKEKAGRLLNREGFLETAFLPESTMDGFFAARLRKTT